MKIDINNIPEKGLELSENVLASEWDIEREDIKFKSPIEIQAKATKEDEEVIVEVSVSAVMDEECARCLKRFDAPLYKQFYLSYDTASSNPEGIGLPIPYKEGPKGAIDLSDSIREEIVLDYPMRPLCREDCKGLCHVCGQNLNEKECQCPGS